MGDERARLAADMIEVHGAGAADVARQNAARAARTGARETVRRWLAVVAAIQAARQGADGATEEAPCRPTSSP
jgi:hypothetical protein